MDIRPVEPTAEEIAFLHDRIDEHNVEVTGYDDGRYLTFLVHAPPDAAGAPESSSGSDVIAGLHGWTWGGAAWVDVLWVHAAHRAGGLGSQLLERAEQTAIERGCDLIALGTHTFQARPFYERHGYEVVGFLPGYPRHHGQYTMRKALGPTSE